MLALAALVLAACVIAGRDPRGPAAAGAAAGPIVIAGAACFLAGIAPPRPRLLPDWNAWRAWTPHASGLGIAAGGGTRRDLAPGSRAGLATIKLAALLSRPRGGRAW